LKGIRIFYVLCCSVLFRRYWRRSWSSSIAAAWRKPTPYLILDARYEKVREDGVIRTKAVQVAIGINEDGRRCVLAVEMAQRESHTS
jgi:transposase-like protein